MSHIFQNDDVDQLDCVPDTILLLILNKIGDVKSLGRCFAVSRRFHSLVPQVSSVLVRVDCVISDDDDDHDHDHENPSPSSSHSSKPCSFFRLFFTNLLKPFHSLGQRLSSVKPPRVNPNDSVQNDRVFETIGGGVTHHSPSQVLKSFTDLRTLRIELPSGELGIDEGVLLKWRAHFGSTLDSCVIFGASSVVKSSTTTTTAGTITEDNGSIPESFYTNGVLKMRVVWTISSLIAASARHYLLQPIISEHRGLESLVLSDVDGQGVLCMDKDQLEELRVKPLSASSASKRTLIPALSMRLWYAPHLELPCGVVLKGATLVAIRPSEVNAKKELIGGSGSGSGSGSPDLSWVGSAFEEPYGMAATLLVKQRTYCLEMNSF